MNPGNKRWGHYKDERDWPKYNETLVRRGELYLSLEFLETWSEDLHSMNKGKVGARYLYPDPYITFLGYTHIMLGVDYRGLEGFTRGLTRLAQVPSPDYTTICRRVNRLRIAIKTTLLDHRGEDVVVSLDSSGVKVSNRGEWMREKWRVRRGWIKVHVVVEEKGKQCVALAVTDDSVGDQEMFAPLVWMAGEVVRSVGGRMVQVNADGIHDTRGSFTVLDELGVTPGIKIRRNARALSRGCPLRRRHVLEFRELGYAGWRDRYRYGFRWRVEGCFSAVKRLTGECVSATGREYMFGEVALKFLFYNALLRFDAEGVAPWARS
jgi:hypothetical protein